MPAPQDPAELSLVIKALTSGLSNCYLWDERAVRNFSPGATNLTPRGVIEELIRYVKDGGAVLQVEEKRPEYNEKRFYYKAIIPVTGFVRGLFVEMVLEDDDPDVPAVLIVSAHEQRS